MGPVRDLYLRMGVELVEEVHDTVSLQCRGDYDHVLLILSPVTAVRSTHLLPLHPRVRQLLELNHINVNVNQLFLVWLK